MRIVIFLAMSGLLSPIAFAGSHLDVNEIKKEFKAYQARAIGHPVSGDVTHVVRSSYGSPDGIMARVVVREFYTASFFSVEILDWSIDPFLPPSTLKLRTFTPFELPHGPYNQLKSVISYYRPAGKEPASERYQFLFSKNDGSNEIYCTLDVPFDRNVDLNTLKLECQNLD